MPGFLPLSMARRTTTPRSSQGTKWHPINPESQPSFTIFLRVPTEFLQCHHAQFLLAFCWCNFCSCQAERLQWAGLRAIFDSESSTEWFLLCFYLENGGKLKKKRVKFCEVQSESSSGTCLLRLSWEENWSAGPIPSQEGRKQSRCHQCSVWTRFPAASNALTTKCHFVIRERKSHQNTIHLFVKFQTLNNWQMQRTCWVEWKCKTTQGLCTCAGRKKLTDIEISSVLSVFVVENADPFFVSIRTWMFVSKRYVLPLNEIVVSAGNCFPINTNLVGNLGHSMRHDSKQWSQWSKFSLNMRIPTVFRTNPALRSDVQRLGCSNGQWQIWGDEGFQATEPQCLTTNFWAQKPFLHSKKLRVFLDTCTDTLIGPFPHAPSIVTW